MSSSPILVTATAARNRLMTRVMQFLQWWRAELEASLPATWREALHGNVARAMLGIDGDMIVGYARKLGGIVETARTEIMTLDVEGRRMALRRLAEAQGASGTSVQLVVSADACLRKTIELPAATEEALFQVVGFELDRHTPFRADQAYFDVVSLGRTAGGSRVRVELLVIPRPRLDALVRSIEALNVTVSSAVALPASKASSISLDLLRNYRKPDLRLTPAARLNWGLTAALAVMLGAALLLPVWQKRDSAIALLPKVNAAHAESAQVERTRGDIDRLVADANYVLTRKHSGVPMIVMLEDLAKALPDTTWVQQMEMKSGPKHKDLSLQGETATSSTVIETLERSAYLRNPTFRSQVTKIPGQSLERYHVAAEVKGRNLPLPVDDLNIVVPPAAILAPAPLPSVQIPAATMPDQGIKGGAPSTSPVAAPSPPSVAAPIPPKASSTQAPPTSPSSPEAPAKGKP